MRMQQGRTPDPADPVWCASHPAKAPPAQAPAPTLRRGSGGPYGTPRHGIAASLCFSPPHCLVAAVGAAEAHTSLKCLRCLAAGASLSPPRLARALSAHSRPRPPWSILLLCRWGSGALRILLSFPRRARGASRIARASREGRGPQAVVQDARSRLGRPPAFVVGRRCGACIADPQSSPLRHAAGTASRSGPPLRLSGAIPMW